MSDVLLSVAFKVGLNCGWRLGRLKSMLGPCSAIYLSWNGYAVKDSCTAFQGS